MKNETFIISETIAEKLALIAKNFKTCKNSNFIKNFFNHLNSFDFIQKINYYSEFHEIHLSFKIDFIEIEIVFILKDNDKILEKEDSRFILSNEYIFENDIKSISFYYKYIIPKRQGKLRIMAFLETDLYDFDGKKLDLNCISYEDLFLKYCL